MYIFIYITPLPCNQILFLLIRKNVLHSYVLIALRTRDNQRGNISAKPRRRIRARRIPSIRNMGIREMLFRDESPCLVTRSYLLIFRADGSSSLLYRLRNRQETLITSILYKRNVSDTDDIYKLRLFALRKYKKC